MAADLHCHTKMSDGSVGIDEVVLLAKTHGIPTIAVTDHDTFAGSTRAKIFGDRHGVEVLSGAEFSTVDPATGRKAHILCYLCDNTDRLEGLCKRISDRRRRASCIMIQKVMRLYPITAEMIMRRAQGSTNIYKQHIMHALVDAGYASDIFGETYYKLFNSKVGLAYYPVRYPDVHDVIRQVHEAGGVAVLAHPGEYDSYDLLEQLARDHEIEGVEVWHPRNKPGDEERFMATAKKYSLVMTGGTDFHGMYTKNKTPIGTCLTPDEQINELKKAKVKLSK
ncbi:PHP domain-containing protein [Caproiciproducens galactitolivorans]|uniref:PHP domain-containing protein n=1 Tax=Caproiciproducens galactitolivorans TaxID=642589 RepID=UPI00159A758E|nr:PHP domain-containing protein [Caproiciproducens galactitolivorans]QEY34290.1 PHP domain-containing protein [Caproiciproducens galactitolivorans]